jgi:hypothetical protein
MEYIRNKFDTEDSTGKVSMGVSNKEDFELYYEKDLGVKQILINIIFNNRRLLWQLPTMEEFY